MIVIEVSIQSLRQVGIFNLIRPRAISASFNGLVSPSIIAAKIARAETVLKLEATDESLIESSSNISSSCWI